MKMLRDCFKKVVQKFQKLGCQFCKASRYAGRSSMRKYGFKGVFIVSSAFQQGSTQLRCIPKATNGTLCPSNVPQVLQPVQEPALDNLKALVTRYFQLVAYVDIGLNETIKQFSGVQEAAMEKEIHATKIGHPGIIDT